MNPASLFARPEALAVLLLAPAAWAFLSWRERSRRRDLEAWVGPRIDQVSTERRTWTATARPLVFAAAIALALVAWLDPVGPEKDVDLSSRGVDLVVCLDVSRSMGARDLAPDRLTRAHDAIRALCARAHGDRIALVVFAGEARLAVPLTKDLESVAHIADLSDPLLPLRGGTDLGAALEAARTALGDAGGKHEAVILVTDGEDLSGHGLEAARRLAAQGIAVHAVGFGTALGGKISVTDGSSERFLSDREGRDVVTAMDPASLARLARETGGAYLDAASTRDPLVRLYEDHVVPMAAKAFEPERRRHREHRFQWPLLGAFALLVLELSVSDRRRT